MLGLTQLWPGDRTNRAATIDIIAIHGLDTQSPTTWSAYRNHKDDADGYVHWLQDADMLHATFPRARIYTYDWQSWTYADAVQDSLRGHAQTFLDKLDSRDSPGRHLILIASCFGGLLLAKAVTLSHLTNSSDNMLLSQLRGIIFLGTPFRGSDAGTAASIRARVAKVMGGEASEELLRYLNRNDSTMSELAEDFERILNLHSFKIQLIGYYETKVTQIYNSVLPSLIVPLITPGPLVLVPRDSVNVANCDLRPIHVKHSLLNKFFGPEDYNFRMVCDGLQKLVRHAEQCDIQQKLKDYYEYKNGRRLRIERLSGDRLPMESCYINLCITEHVRDHEENAAIDTPITLRTLFQVRERKDGTNARPNRILIWGRAGVGKSTLCKKIVYEFIHNSLWKDLFDYIFWIPLRELKVDGIDSITLEDLILKRFFTTADQALTRDHLKVVSQHRVLYVLDGLDEVSYTLDPDLPAGQLLQELLDCENIILTSRPHSTNLLQDNRPHLEVETVGFLEDQVDEYLDAASEQTPETRAQIRLFIREYHLVRTLTRIPIQLDAICYCWTTMVKPDEIVTTTSLYQKIELKLWEKYVTLVEQSLTMSQVRGATAIKELVKDERRFLEHLAFHGLYDQVVEFGVERIETTQIPRLNNHLVSNSFLRSSDHSVKPEIQTYHFMHLTFQEYFAAHYFVRHWVLNRESVFTRKQQGSGSSRTGQQVSPLDFLQTEKYSTRYGAFWQFVVALLQEEAEIAFLQQFFEALEAEPRDLLGPTHQRLIVNCLNEVHVVDKKSSPWAEKVEGYFQWFIFERNNRGDDGFRIMSYYVECPDSMIVTLMKGSPRALSLGVKYLNKRAHVPPELLDLTIELLDTHPPDEVETMMYKIIAANSYHDSSQRVTEFWRNLHLPANRHRDRIINEMESPYQDLLVSFLVKVLDGEHSYSKWCIVCRLKWERLVPLALLRSLSSILENEILQSSFQVKTIQVLANHEQAKELVIKKTRQLLQNGDPSEQLEVAKTLRHHPMVKEAAAGVLAQLLRANRPDIQLKAASVLQWYSGLPSKIIQELVNHLQDPDQDPYMQSLAAIVLAGRNPPLKVADQVSLQLLNNGEVNFRLCATQALIRYSEHNQLSESAAESLMEMLENDVDERIRCEASCALSLQRQLPKTVVEAATRLLNESKCQCEIDSYNGGECQGEKIRDNAAKAIWKLTELPEIAVEAALRIFRCEESENDPSFHSEIVQRQKHLSEATIQRLAQYLRLEGVQFYTVRVSAIEILATCNRLSDDLIKISLQNDIGLPGEFDTTVVEALAPVEDLSQEIIQYLLSLPKGNNHTQLCRFRKECYQALPNLDQRAMCRLLHEWLFQSFSMSFACYIVDESLYINEDEKPVTVVYLGHHKVASLRSALQQLQEEEKLPPFYHQILDNNRYWGDWR